MSAAGLPERNSVEKALAVLEVLGTGQSLRLGEIATRLQLPKSTVHRILQTLTASRYVVSAPGGSYAVGPAALGLAGRILDSDVRRLAGPIVTALQSHTGHAVHFALLNGTTAVYVIKIESDRGYQMASRVGMPVTLHSTAVGKAILAALPLEEAERLLQLEPLVARTEHTLSSLPDVLADLELVRERGYSIDDEENEANVRCVGAVVRNGLGAVLGAISVSALTLTLSMEEAELLGPEVRDAADRVSASLGAPQTAESKPLSGSSQ